MSSQQAQRETPLQAELHAMGRAARAAAREVARTPAALKNAALEAAAREIRRKAGAILAANQADVARAI